MKIIGLSLLLFILLFAYCQTTQEQYYIYNIVSFEGDFTREDFKVYYDDGVEVKRMRNENGEKARFSTPAGALMYFISQGWEMYLNGSVKEAVGSMQQTKNTKLILYGKDKSIVITTPYFLRLPVPCSITGQYIHSWNTN